MPDHYSNIGVPAASQKLYRVMRVDTDGRPRTGRKSSVLGVRIGPPNKVIDIRVKDGLVHPYTGGLSVIPGSPRHIAKEFLPLALGGTGEDPLWYLPTVDGYFGLVYTPDPSNPTRHGYISPTYSMPIEQYERMLIATSGSLGLIIARMSRGSGSR